MKLLTEELKQKLPDMGETEDIKDPKAQVKLFTPWANWSWYLIEYDEEKELAFGLADGFEQELGYIDLKEIKALEGPAGLKVERDKWWQPKTVSEIKEG